MRAAVLSLHPELASSSRLPVLGREGQQIRFAEVLFLLGAGLCAALAMSFVELKMIFAYFGLKAVPGNAIILAIFPMAFGLASAPRRSAGMIMGSSALASACAIRFGGFGGIGFGALTSLTLIGPLLDFALRRAKHGRGLYLAFALAGLGGNLAALAVRASIKFAGLDHAAGKPLAVWLPQAIFTYPVCGVLAGLLSALVWFQFREDRRKQRTAGFAE